jgi:hypothetical protein
MVQRYDGKTLNGSPPDAGANLQFVPIATIDGTDLEISASDEMPDMKSLPLFS